MIRVEDLEAAVLIRMDDGENRFRLDSLSDWSEALDKAESILDGRPLITSGTGKFYSNGLDLDWLRARNDPWDDVLSALHALLARILSYPAITIAAVNGHAFAGGAVLVAAHDLIVMRNDRGYWCVNEVDLGLPLSNPMLEVLRARLPSAALQLATLTGRRFAGEDAVSAGIADVTCHGDRVLPEALEMARGLSGKNPKVIASHKRRLFANALAACDA